MAAERAQPYTYDLGLLMCNDSNPLPSLDGNDKERILAETARDCAQGLINQLLTTCPITRAADDGALQITLPAPETPLPREKPVPKEKEKTKWEKFADKKGIKPKKRDGKLKFDEGTGEWVPKYGYKKSADAGPGDWMEIVDDKAEQAEKVGSNGKPNGRRRKVKKG